jgi:hypothetical protein
MPTTTQFVIAEQSKPGVLARVADVLGSAGINIKAFSALENTGTAAGTLRFVLADPDKARQAFKDAKVPFTEETALVLSLPNRPGALSDIAQHLAKAHINIACGYYTPSREGGKAIVILTVSDTDKAVEVLQSQSLDVI